VSKEYGIKKFVFVVSLIFLSASLLSAQSLVEVAKKERARRAALKAQGKKSILVTNVDLKKGYKPPTVSAESKAKTTQRSARQVPPRNQKSESERPTSARPSRERSSQQAKQYRDQASDSYSDRTFATKVLLSSDLVKNSEFALKKPDGKYAELSLQGVLELQVDIKNGPGADVAIYSKLSGAQETRSGGEEEGGIPETLGLDLHEGVWYGVMALNKRGEWEDLGRGRGRGASEKFDLGRLPSTQRIRIVFRPAITPGVPVKYMRSHSRELTCGIDAVETLH
jgi:hypothetical protein